MAYPVATLADGSTKMSDGTITRKQTKKNVVSPKFNLFDFGTPATSSGASFVNGQNSIAENIIGPSVTDTLRNNTAVSAPLPKINEPMFSEQSKRSLWKAEGLDEAGFDVNAFDKNGPGMYIKQEYIDRYKLPETSAGQSDTMGIEQANAGEVKPLKLFSEEQNAYDKMLADGISEQEATETIRERRSQLLGGDTKLTDLETKALQKMREDGISAKEATESLIEFRKQREVLKTKVLEEQANISPAERFTNALIGASVGALETTGKVFDFVTGSDIGEQIERAKEKNLSYKGGFGIGESIGKGAAQFGIATALAPTALTTSTSLSGMAGQGALQGAAGMIGEKGKDTTAGDITTGALAGGAFGAAGYGVAKGLSKGVEAGKKYLQGKAPQIALGGLINPQKLEYVKKALQVDEGVATPKDVGKWILDRVKSGDKESIANQLIKYAEKTKSSVDEALSSIPGTFKNVDAKKALSQLKNDLNGIAGMESKVAEIDVLLSKGEYTLSDLNAIKRELDQTYNVYKQSGDVSANLKAQGLNKVRSGIRSFIEDEADKFDVDIRKLNNETAVARGLADGITKKDNADAVRQFLTAFAPSGLGATIGAGQSMARGEDPITVIRDAVLGGIIAKAGTSTTFRTKVASLLNDLGSKEISALEAYIKSGGKETIGQKVAQDLARKIKLLPAPSGKVPFAQQKPIILPKSVTDLKLGKTDIGKAKIGTQIPILKQATTPAKTVLHEEAKKYKSAEEFVKASGEPLYHGTNAKFNVFDENKIGSSTDPGIFGHGFYFGNTKHFAKVAPRGTEAKTIMEVYPTSRKLFELDKIKSVQEMADLLDISELQLIKDSSGKVRPKPDFARQFTSALKDLGYDGVVIKRGGDAIETVIFDSKNIKTKSQLKQIWEEANK